MLEKIVKDGLMVIGILVVIGLVIIYGCYLVDKTKLRRRNKPLKKSVKQVLNNEHIYCMSDCIYKDSCSRHMSSIEYPDETYLLAFMKDTPYCMYDDRFVELFEE